MIFQALQSELFRFRFHSLGSNIEKIPEFSLPMNKINIFYKMFCYKKLLLNPGWSNQDGTWHNTASDLFERYFSSWLNRIVLKNIWFMVPIKSFSNMISMQDIRISRILFEFCNIQIFIKETDRNNAICVDFWLVSSQLCSWSFLSLLFPISFPIFLFAIQIVEFVRKPWYIR